MPDPRQTHGRPTECIRAEFSADGFVIDPDANVEQWDDVMLGGMIAQRFGSIDDHVDGWKYIYSVGEFIYFAR